MKSLESIYNSILLETQNPNIDIELLKSCTDGTYNINDDGSIDVTGTVILCDGVLTKILFKFRHVSGSFNCSNNYLTSLEGVPITVGGIFDCGYNNLTSLEYAPNNVGSIFRCDYNKLVSLDGAPFVSDSFICDYNHLTTLEGAPTTVGGNFYCQNNQLTSLEGAPNSVGGYFYCYNNQLTSLEGAPTVVGGNFSCYNNPKLPYSELFKIVDRVKGNILYFSYRTPEDKDKIRRDREVKGVLKDDELGNLDV